MDDLGARMLAYLARELRIDVAGVGDDTPLVTSGRVDSMAIVRLAAFLERELGIRIPDRDVNREHFDTIARIRSYVATRRAR